MTHEPPMTLLEELLLLAIDPQKGQLTPLNPVSLAHASAGAILMDLALRNRIDNDLRDVFTVDPTPTGDDILDPVLKAMAESPVLTPYPISHWLHEIADKADVIEDKAMRRLERRGLIRKNYGLPWLFGMSQSSGIDDKKVGEVKALLSGVLYGDQVPTARGIMLTGLAESLGLFRSILNETEAKDARARIAEIARMDLISQAVAKEIAAQPKIAVVQ